RAQVGARLRLSTGCPGVVVGAVPIPVRSGHYPAGTPPAYGPVGGTMSLLAQLTAAIGDGSIEVIDLTAPLSETTPILKLPEPFGNTVNFSLREISRYDERGPAWYWNDIVTGEHTGTHFDAPVHWITGRDGDDVSQVAPQRLVAPAVVLDVADRVAGDPDFLLQIDDVREWTRA